LLRKTFSGMMVLALLLISMLTLAFNIQPVKAEPKTIIVPDDYLTIQGAIIHAMEMDTIYVRAGEYKENVIIDKSIFLIGEKADITEIDGCLDTAVKIISNEVTVANFSITCNVGDVVRIEYSSDNTITNNNITCNVGDVVRIEYSSDNTITNNNITCNVGVGVWIGLHSSNNTFSENEINTNVGDGVWLFGSTNSFFDDKVTINIGVGICIGPYASDNILNFATINVNMGKIVDYELTAPTTIDNYNGLWQTENFVITLTASDDKSGVSEIYYMINYGPIRNVGTYGQPYITIQGANNTLEYWSVDNAGNEELPHKILTGIKLDKTAPTGSITINNNATYTTSTSATLKLTATDATSGVYQVRYSNYGVWDIEPWETPSPTKTWTLTSGEGTKTVYYQIKDNAGLVSETYSDTIILDTAPPTGSITINSGATCTTSTSVTLTLSATDAGSGVAQMRFSHNNVTWTLWEAYSTSKAWTLTTDDGTKTVYVQYRDNTGLISPPYQDTIILDTTKPTASAGTDQTVNEDTLVTFDGSASQDENGIQSYTWTFTDVTPQTLTGKYPTYTFTTPSTYLVTLTVEDAAGNTATETVTITVLLDTDGDGIGENADTDDDNDGVLDVNDAFPLDPTESVDTDGDGVGNNADTDDDNDGMPDAWETENRFDPFDAADASLDSDGDGLINLEEYQGGTDPNVSDAEAPPTDASPLWILGAAVTTIAIAMALMFLWRRRK